MNTTKKKLSKLHKEQLKAVGVTNYGMKKFAIKYLSNIIRDDETIKGVVYGRYHEGSGFLTLEEGTLIATDRRVIFLDHKPGFSNFEEITYDMVGGVRHQRFASFNTIVLHTRMGDFTVAYTNPKCSKIFTEYIESRRIARDASQPIMTPANNLAAVQQVASSNNAVEPVGFIDQKSLIFLRQNTTAVLSTANSRGVVAGSVVYYIVDQLNRLYILTRTETKKVKNILGHKQVALTIFNADTAETLTVSGQAEFEKDQEVIDYVFAQVMQPHDYAGHRRLPPVAYLKKGAFTVIRITPLSANYSDYKK